MTKYLSIEIPSQHLKKVFPDLLVIKKRLVYVIENDDGDDINEDRRRKKEKVRRM